MAYEHDPVPRLRRELGEQLVRDIAERGTWDAAVLMRTDPPRISDLRNGRLKRFSLATLVRYLSRLNYRVELRWEKRRLDEHRSKAR
jgi:predicted XRE-type DNA-binding protein